MNNVTLSVTYDSSRFSFVLFTVWCLIYGIPFCITSFCHVCYFCELQVGDRCGGRCVMWSCVDVSYTGVPFMIIGQQTLECRSGPERHVTRQSQHTVQKYFITVRILS